MLSHKKYASPTAAVLAASMLMVASGTAMSAVVCNTATVPLAVPQNTVGIYLDLVTGATGTATPPAGWDFNPYEQSAANGLTFWFNNDTTNKGAVSNGTAYSVLPAGATVGPAQTYLSTNVAAAMAPWRVANTGQYLGIRVFNEGTATLNYGWVQLDTSTTASPGYPATINGFCFQNDGTAITTGATTPVTLQNFSVD